MLELTIINLSWNHYNGFLFKLLEFDHRLMPGNERALFGIKRVKELESKTVDELFK